MVSISRSWRQGARSRGAAPIPTSARRAAGVRGILPSMSIRLREARLAAGLGTQALSTRAGVSRNLVLRTEQGNGGGTAVATVALLHDALKVRRAWLAFGELPVS